MKTILSCASALVLLTSCGVFGLSSEEREQVQDYRVRGNRYFDTAASTNSEQYDFKALDQYRKGLAISPDDYRLLQRQAWCYLKLGHRNPAYLAQAEKIFKDLMPKRSERAHDARTIMGYGVTLHRMGFNELGEANLLEQEAKNQTTASGTGDVADPKARAAEKRVRADNYFRGAERQLTRLIGRRERVRTAHKHLMNLKVHQGDIEGALHHGTQLLAILAEERKHWERRYRETTQKEYEDTVVRTALAELDKLELQYRTEVVDYLHKLKRFDEALTQLDKILELNPNLSDRYYDRGVCLRSLGKDGDARRDFRKFLGTTNRPSKDKKVVDAFQFTYRK